MEHTQQVWDLSKYDKGTKNMTGQVIWITGLSGAGKTTLAEELNIRLKKKYIHSIVLDGDVLRNIFTTGSFGKKAYDRNSRINLALKYGILSKTLSSQGFTVIIATISMFNEIYVWNRANIKNYFEVYLKVSVDQLSMRDQKKIYKRYRDGDLYDVAGLDVTVDEPLSADVIYDFDQQPFLWSSPKNLADKLMEDLEKRSSVFDSNIENKMRNKK